MKFSQGEYELTEKYDLDLRNKIGTFQTKTKTRKGMSIVMITSYGLKRNNWANGINAQINIVRGSLRFLSIRTYITPLASVSYSSQAPL